MGDRSLTNGSLTITVAQLGAELISLRSAGGVEYLWQADPKIWARRAPVLFPIVGSLANNSYTFEGKSYSLTQHGFARDMGFEVIKESGTSLSYRLLPTPATREKYPFEFTFVIEYTLIGNALEIVYQVSNDSGRTMPFSIGAHPGFSLARKPGDRLEDYYLTFEKQETLNARLLGADQLLSDQSTRVALDAGGVLPITEDMFNRGALIFLDFKSKHISLCSRKNTGCLRVEFPGFPYLGIWAKPGAPFVCIEPWFGHVDPHGAGGDIMKKPGIIRLPEGEIFTCSHRIVVEE